MEPVVPSHKANQASTANTLSPGARLFTAREARFDFRDDRRGFFRCMPGTP